MSEEEVLQEVRQYLEDNHVTIGTTEALVFTDFVNHEWAYFANEGNSGSGDFLKKMFKGLPFMMEAFRDNDEKRYARISEESGSNIATALSRILEEVVLRVDIERSKVLIPRYRKTYKKIHTL